MKELTIFGVVVMYVILIGSQHLFNYMLRQKDDNPIQVLGAVGIFLSLLGFILLTLKVIEVFK